MLLSSGLKVSKTYSLILNPFQSLNNAVEDNKMQHESSESLIEFGLKVRNKFLQTCKVVT